MPAHELKVESADSGIRLDVYLTQSLPDVPSRTFIKKLIEHGNVTVNGKQEKPHHKVHEGDVVNVEINETPLAPQELEPEDIPLDIFYEDEFLLIVNKPAGMIVHPAQGRNAGTLVNALLYHCQHLSDFNSIMRPGIVHRLDQDTSGLILIAKDNITHTKLSKLFKKRKVEKQYVALVEGQVEFDEGEIDAPIGRDPHHHDKRTVRFDDSAREAYTKYKVLARYSKSTKLALFPKTGRTHQLRVHLAHFKHPVLGDAKYGHKNNFSRLALHAQSIGFQHPGTGVFLQASAALPPEFQNLK